MKRGITHIFLKRILTSIIVLFLLISFLFVLIRISPGDPSLKFVSPGLSPQLAEKVKESFSLNEPVFNQYISFLSNAIKGDFGISYNHRVPVISVISDYLPFTLIFVSVSFLIQVFLSFILAVKSVKKINGLFDRIASRLTLILYATPVFVTGVFLIFFFSELLGIFPTSGIKSYDHERYSFLGKIIDYAKHLALPLITLSVIEIAIFYKYLRDNLLEVYNKSFVVNLRALGFGEGEILFKHVLPNAVNPLITIAGIELGVMLGGTLIVEVIYGLPGMGRLTINAILFRDYPLIIGCAFISGALIIITNFIADIIKIKIDKRLIAGGLT
jgi:peptide/nickel transport system permease protein